MIPIGTEVRIKKTSSYYNQNEKGNAIVVSNTYGIMPYKIEWDGKSNCYVYNEKDLEIINNTYEIY